jgi:predicted nucleic acid-binding protein
LVCAHDSEIEEAHGISYRAAMIVSAAYMKIAAVILTADLNEDRQLEGITIVNPFR